MLLIGASSATAAVAKPCHVDMKVSGDQSFMDSNISVSVAKTTKNGKPWIVLQANDMSNKPPYLLWLGFPEPAGSGKISLYEDSSNHMNFKIIGGADYDAFNSHQLKRDPGFISISKLEDQWLTAKIEGVLSDHDNGNSIRVELNISVALPPARCTRK